MTVTELCAHLLASYSGDLPVMVQGYEGGLTELTPAHVTQTPIVRDYWAGEYLGPHEPWPAPGEDVEAKAEPDRQADGEAVIFWRAVP